MFEPQKITLGTPLQFYLETIVHADKFYWYIARSCSLYLYITNTNETFIKPHHILLTGPFPTFSVTCTSLYPILWPNMDVIVVSTPLL